MSDNARQRLEDLLARRDALRERIQRIHGRLDSARTDKAAVEAECKQHGVDPDRLDEAIDKLTSRFNTAVEDLATRIAEAEEAIAPYLEET